MQRKTYAFEKEKRFGKREQWQGRFELRELTCRFSAAAEQSCFCLVPWIWSAKVWFCLWIGEQKWKKVRAEAFLRCSVWELIIRNLVWGNFLFIFIKLLSSVQKISSLIKIIIWIYHSLFLWIFIYIWIKINMIKNLLRYYKDNK